MPTLKQDIELVEKNSDAVLEICNRLGLKTQAARDFVIIALANAQLMDRKQQDYGPRNITKGGVFGCILRASDKFERLFNLYNKRRARAVNEPIMDSLRDVGNYMIIALMLENGRWPNE